MSGHRVRRVRLRDVERERDGAAGADPVTEVRQIAPGAGARRGRGCGGLDGQRLGV